MKMRRFSRNGSNEAFELELAWVPGTEGVPYGFGHGDRRRMIEIDGFYIGTTPVTQAFWSYVMGENPAEHVDLRCPLRMFHGTT